MSDTGTYHGKRPASIPSSKEKTPSCSRGLSSFRVLPLHRGRVGDGEFGGAAETAFDAEVFLADLPARFAEQRAVHLIDRCGTAALASVRDVAGVQFSAVRAGVRHGHTKDRSRFLTDGKHTTTPRRKTSIKDIHIRTLALFAFCSSIL